MVPQRDLITIDSLVDSVLGFGPGEKELYRVTYSMGHAGASRKSPNDAPWETLTLRLRRTISAPLLTVARSWRYEEEQKTGE